MEKAKAEKGAASAELTEELAALGTDLQNTQAAMEADENFLEDLTSKCQQKAADWDTRSSTRTSELTAIANALEMLKGDVSKMYGSTDLGLVTKRTPKVRKARAAPAKGSKDALRAAMRQVAKEEKAAGGHWQWIPDHVATQTSSSVKQSTGFGATPATAAAAAPAAAPAAKEEVAETSDDDADDDDID